MPAGVNSIQRERRPAGISFALTLLLGPSGWQAVDESENTWLFMRCRAQSNWFTRGSGFPITLRSMSINYLYIHDNNSVVLDSPTSAVQQETAYNLGLGSAADGRTGHA